ncbi:MAG: hypothetical protein ACOCVM_00385 [Desulfovibrionaceae bacterium]
MSDFKRYVGVDYSGAGTPEASLKGLRVYLAEDDGQPEEVPPPPSPRKYWSRKEFAGWLVDLLSEDVPTLVGMDHAFSFPLRYFEVHGVKPDWDVFLEDFHRHWPTDEDYVYVDFVRDGSMGRGPERSGDSLWCRLTEIRAGAKSVFHFDVPGQVAKSTHAGLPWLRRMRRELGGKAHFWPFDGWNPPRDRSVVAETYPALWSKDFPREGRTPDQHDAYSLAAGLARADRRGELEPLFLPDLNPQERMVAAVEGWILGVQG